MGDPLRERLEAERRRILAARARHESEVPVRFLRQTSHFTTPASNEANILKAAQGLGFAEKILAKSGLAVGAVARALGVPEATVASLLASGRTPPLVVIDGEDATALDPAVMSVGRANAVGAFSQLATPGSLLFYRPSGIELEHCLEDLFFVIEKTAEVTRGRRFPIDGISWPKTEDADELRFLDEVLRELEARHEIPKVRVHFLVESGRAVSRIEALVDAILPRLAGIVFGIADYSADVGLPEVRNDHPVCDAARMAIVNAAGAANVPAIDAMTFEYPVKDASLDAAANEKKILGALRRCYDDARHGLALGMEGKWVGHPLQLLANELAYRDLVSAATVEADVRDARAYLAAVAKGRGAAMIGGRMADRATDRHVRRRLRRARAHGLLAEDVARELGVSE
ncbi:MAG TPA: aldolase/citrate lyase family protein [Planctomycetota bacterium]|nr:aldolase/citrate lyase family protein [Planctomycetota bacterium]